MDIKKFEINLKKINTLKQNIDLSGEEISKLEIELLKTYVKKLFESITLEENISMDEPVMSHPPAETVQATPVVEPVAPVKDTSPQEKEVEAVEIVEQETQIEVPEEETVPTDSYDEILLSIFENGKSSELSDKLSSMPIQDIKKAIGINDRIFTINELFGGDKDLFNDTLDKLNAMSNFDEAKDYLLLHIAQTYDWSKKDNVKKAKRFIKVVRRRYP